MRLQIGWPFVLGAAFLVVLSGCTGVTQIHYQQVLNFEKFGPEEVLNKQYYGGYALYTITSIDNSSRDLDFDFKAIKLSGIGADPPAFNVPWQKQPYWWTGHALVAAGSKKNNIGCVVIPTGGFLDKNFLSLRYNSTGSESVLLVRDGGSKPPRPDATELLEPVDLAELCGR